MTPTTATPPVKVAERLSTHANRRGVDTKPVVLSAVATHCLFLGVETEARSEIVGALGRLAEADVDQFGAAYRSVWRAHAEAFPYLRGHLGPFTEWLAPASDESKARALAAALVESAEMDLHASAEADGVQGDLLGQVLTAVEAPGDRTARGAFYTPVSVAHLMAALSGPVEHETFSDPCCGAGGLAVASVREMRRAGKRPETVQWVLNDLDPTAVAVAGVAMSIHGMPSVSLTCGNALVPPTLSA